MPNVIQLLIRRYVMVVLKIPPIFSLRQIYLLRFSEINVKNIVEHCDDLQYLFTASSIPRITDESSSEGQTIIKYTKLLSSFAKNG